MNSYELAEKFRQLRHLIATKSPLAKLLQKMAESEFRLNETFDQTIQSFGDRVVGRTITEREYYESVEQPLEIKLVSFKSQLSSPKKFFVEISKLEDCLGELDQELKQNDEEPLKGFLKQITNFSRKYEALFLRNSYSSAMLLEASAENLLETFKTISNLTLGIESNLLGVDRYDETLGELTLFLEADCPYKVFVEKLQAIQEIYSELCLLGNIAEADFPLQMAKVESGSLFAKIFGEARLIKIFEETIKSAVSFFYRNYTLEGKVASIPRKTAAIEKILELHKKLEEAGIDTSESKEKLQKSSVILAEQLNCLLLGEAKVEVNGEKLSIDQSLQQKYLESSKTYFLRGSGAGDQPEGE